MKLEAIVSFDEYFTPQKIRSSFKLLSVAIVIALAGLFAMLSYRFFYMPMIRHGKDSIIVTHKMRLHTLAKRFQDKGLFPSKAVMLFWCHMFNFEDQLHTGEYRIRPVMTAFDLLEDIAQKRGLVLHPFRIGVGWTIARVIAHLNMSDAIQHTIKHPEAYAHLEGALAPNTFYFSWGTTDKAVIQYAADRMSRFMRYAWVHRAKGLPYHKPADALVLASLVQRESTNPADQKMIAGVIINRLNHHMRLQVDPTVSYGLHLPFGVMLKRKDLEKVTPYNTYQVFGLPPTPIAIPSKTAIMAALHPTKNHDLFYMGNGHGQHVFSKTYAHHMKLVNLYRGFYQRSAYRRERQAEREVMMKMAILGVFV